MKKAAVTILATLTAWRLFAQGTVLLNNRNSLVTSHVWASLVTEVQLQCNGSNDTPPGSTPYEAYGYFLIGANGTGGRFGAATTFAQLLAANGTNQPDSSLVPMGQTTTFRTGAAASNLAGITVTLAGIPADSAAAPLELAVWDNSSGLFSTWSQASIGWENGLIVAAKSGAFNVFNIGGAVNTPPDLPIPSFGMGIPEPATGARLVLGGASMIICRRTTSRCRTG
jgi:hypothetical protein